MIKRLLPYAVLFFATETLVRLSLMLRAFFDVEFNPTDTGLLLTLGLWFDLVTASFVLLPVALYHMALPARLHGSGVDRKIDLFLRFTYCYLLLFSAVAEHLFWEEFTTRFNFIAVDYLIYTQEVIGNISESYPLGWLLFGIGASALALTWFSYRWFLPTTLKPGFLKRLAQTATVGMTCALLYLSSSLDQIRIQNNAEAGELAANGIYNLFYAFWHNEISYERFYAKKPDLEVIADTRALLAEKNQTFLKPGGKDFTRVVRSQGKERHKNIILVVMESMSAEYMQAFGNTQNLTPNLDRLAKEGLFFTQTYATGTRTVRGLEAVTLSIPPTPGQSIIRRPGNENLFSLGFVMQDRGYQTTFIYGGYGYFDNMNNFFAGNGFSILDRTSMSKEETQFANIWGVCDEDMFTRAIREADASYKSGKPFLHLIMTTSNHRPYTYPEGRIDIPSHSNRLGGVKYADYSVGKLIEDAKKKPWFKDTVFVFVADHTAGAGGKAELDPRKYHIPMIFYAPGFIAPRRYDAIASQIDLAPMLLGLLNFSYYTKFYGENLLSDPDEIPHAFISNYQKVALVKNDEITILSPKLGIEQFNWPDSTRTNTLDAQRVRDTISYYQSASWWKDVYRRIPTVLSKGSQ